MTSNAQTTEETPKSMNIIGSTPPEKFKTDSSTTPRKRRENVNDKAERYLREGRLRVVRVDGNLIVAKCRGGGVIYDLGHDPKAMQYRCTCPARGPCAHLVALQRVTAVER